MPQQFDLLKASAVTQIQDDLESAVESDRILAEAAATTATTQAGIATDAAGQAQASAISAGAQIYADTTAGLAATSDGGFFYVPEFGGLRAYENDAGAAVAGPFVGQPVFVLRSTLIAAIASGYDPDAGTDITAGGQSYVRSAGATALPGLPGWLPFGDVFFEHFGSVGDGDESRAVANSAAIAACIDYVRQRTGRGMIRFSGRHVVAEPVVIPQNAPAIFLKGDGAAENIAASDIRGANTVGPVIRWKGNYPRGEDFIVSSTNARRTSLRITKDNYASEGLDRDDQNYGIWFEGDDGQNSPERPIFTRVWSHNQPNDAWVICQRGYAGEFTACGARQAIGHGRVITSGAYTGRADTFSVGVVVFNSWTSKGCSGHGAVDGNPNDATSLNGLRVININGESYSNCTNRDIMFADYESILIGDNCVTIGSGNNGRDLYGALLIGGRNVTIENHRCLAMGTTQSPFKVLATHTADGRVTNGVTIEHFAIPDLTLSSEIPAVDVETGAINVRVIQPAIDGGIPSLSPGAMEEQRADRRRWKGSLQVPLALWGKSESDDTTPGARMATSAGGAVLSIVRDAVALVLDRTNQGDVSRLSLNSQVTGLNSVGGATVGTSSTTIYTLSTRSGGLFCVSGSFADGGTVRRFVDIVHFMWGVSPVVISAREENTPAARTYGVLTNNNLRLTMAAGSYSVRVAGSSVTVA